MTELLEKAFAEAAKLSQDEQDALAALLLDEISSEQRWAQSFAASQDELSALADDALAEFKRGETRPLDEDRDFSHN